MPEIRDGKMDFLKPPKFRDFLEVIRDQTPTSASPRKSLQTVIPAEFCDEQFLSSFSSRIRLTSSNKIYVNAALPKEEDLRNAKLQLNAQNENGSRPSW